MFCRCRELLAFVPRYQLTFELVAEHLLAIQVCSLCWLHRAGKVFNGGIGAACCVKRVLASSNEFMCIRKSRDSFSAW